jgi:hypothetical protein
MDFFNSTLALIVLGMVLLGIGYHKRDSGLGMVIMWAGVLCMLSMMVYTLFKAIHL